jgi:broad specificity phosphatase PhoE
MDDDSWDSSVTVLDFVCDDDSPSVIIKIIDTSAATNHHDTMVSRIVQRHTDTDMTFSLLSSISLLFLWYSCAPPFYVMATADSSSSSKENGRNPRPTSVRFYFVRHGESGANKWGLIAGQDDVPLTDGGVSEAKLLGKSRWIHAAGSSSSSFWRVYSSDLSRARDTALVALKEGQQEHLIPMVKEDPRLRERSYGLRQGFSRSMPEEEILNIWKQYGREPPPYETDEQLWERGREWIQSVLLEVIEIEGLEKVARNGVGADDEIVHHVLVAAHAGLIREILLHLISPAKLVELGARFDANRGNKLIIPNTSVSILEINPFCDRPLEDVKVVDLLNADHLNKVNVYDD